MKRRPQRFYYNIAEARETAKRRHTCLIRLIVRPPQYYVGSPTKEEMKRFREAAQYLGNAPPKIVNDYRRRH